MPTGSVLVTLLTPTRSSPFLPIHRVKLPLNVPSTTVSTVIVVGDRVDPHSLGVKLLRAENLGLMVHLKLIPQPATPSLLVLKVVTVLDPIETPARLATAPLRPVLVIMSLPTLRRWSDLTSDRRVNRSGMKLLSEATQLQAPCLWPLQAQAPLEIPPHMLVQISLKSPLLATLHPEPWNLRPFGLTKLPKLLDGIGRKTLGTPLKRSVSIPLPGPQPFNRTLVTRITPLERCAVTLLLNRCPRPVAPLLSAWTPHLRNDLFGTRPRYLLTWELSLLPSNPPQLGSEPPITRNELIRSWVAPRVESVI